MKLGSKLQEMGWDLGNGENKLLYSYLSWKCPPRVSYNNQTVSLVRNTAEHLKFYQ
jgi:hypothetical protein